MRKKIIAIMIFFVLALVMMACDAGGEASVLTTGNNEPAQAGTASKDA